jgi:hypothetical protein
VLPQGLEVRGVAIVGTAVCVAVFQIRWTGDVAPLGNEHARGQPAKGALQDDPVDEVHLPIAVNVTAKTALLR